MMYRPKTIVSLCIAMLAVTGIPACGPAKSKVEMMTPLDAAIEIDLSPHKVKAALDSGSDPNQQSLSGYTPLIRASGELRVPREREKLTQVQVRSADEIVALLLARGANPNLTTKDGTTALIVATDANRASAVAALLDSGASPEAETVSGDTPLFVAMHRCHIGLVKMFVERGANLAHKNLSGKTVFDVATERCPAALSQLPKA